MVGDSADGGTTPDSGKRREDTTIVSHASILLDTGSCHMR